MAHFLSRQSDASLLLLFYAGICLAVLLLFSVGWTLSVKYFQSKVNSRYLRNWRKSLFDIYSGSNVRKVVEVVVLVLCAVSCALFVYLTVKVSELKYKAIDPEYDKKDFDDIFKAKWVIWTEFVISLLFVGYYIFNFLLAENKVWYLFSVSGIVDPLTIAPGLASPAVGSYFYGFEFLRFIRLGMSLQQIKRHVEGVQAQALLLISTLVCIVCTAAGFIFVVENNAVNEDGQVVNLLDAIYFVVVSISTVGYGDISAKSIMGKVMVIGMLISALALVPLQLDKLLKLIRQSMAKGNKRYTGKADHIVMVSSQGDAISDWLHEFYHPDRNVNAIHAVLLVAADEIPRKAKLALRKSRYEHKVTSLQGHPLIKEDLKRAKLKYAKACIVSADIHATDPEQEDAKTILNAFAIRKYNSRIPLHVQILNPNHKGSLRAAGVQTIICSNDFRMGVIAQNCFTPGFAALINNLIRTNSPKNEARGWQAEYGLGAGNEIYVTSLTPFIGKSFTQAVNVLFEKCGMLLIGIGKSSDQPNVEATMTSTLNSTIDTMGMTNLSASSAILLAGFTMERTKMNPGNGYLIKPDDLGIIICQDEAELKKLHALTADVIDSVTHLQNGPMMMCTENYAYSETPFTVAPGRERKLEDVTLESARALGRRFIVVIGRYVDIISFLDHYRRFKSGDNLKPVIMLAPSPPDDNTWKKLSRFPEVYFVQGISTESADLGRAGALTADNVIILSEGQEKADDLSVDARPIMTFRLVKGGRAFPFIDLAHFPSCQYLGALDTEKYMDIGYNPYYAAGQVFASSNLNTLLIQVFYNKHVVKIFEHLVDGWVFAQKITDKFTECVNKPYRMLFQSLLFHDLIPLGLYRTRAESRLRYVVTNPLPDLIVRSDDIVFVLKNATIARMQKVSHPKPIWEVNAARIDRGRTMDVSKRNLATRAVSRSPSPPAPSNKISQSISKTDASLPDAKPKVKKVDSINLRQPLALSQKVAKEPDTPAMQPTQPTQSDQPALTLRESTFLSPDDQSLTHPVQTLATLAIDQPSTSHPPGSKPLNVAQAIPKPPKRVINSRLKQSLANMRVEIPMEASEPSPQEDTHVRITITVPDQPNNDTPSNNVPLEKKS